MTKENPSLNLQADWSYDPAPQSIEHVTLKDSYDLFINGKFRPSINGSYRNSINPATEKTLAKVAEAGSEDIESAVADLYNNISSPVMTDISIRFSNTDI